MATTGTSLVVEDGNSIKNNDLHVSNRKESLSSVSGEAALSLDSQQQNKRNLVAPVSGWDSVPESNARGVGTTRLPISNANPSTVSPIVPPSQLAVRSKKSIQSVLGWPTETTCIDWVDESGRSAGNATFVLLFVPGNPGVHGWYTKLLADMVRALGPQYCCRAVSYAGHGTDDETIDVESSLNSPTGQDVNVPWTVNGQIRHKISWIDSVIAEHNDDQQRRRRFIFVSHSIGGHMVQRICVARRDIREKTVLALQLMPFVRMDAPAKQQWVLSTAAQHPTSSIRVGKTVTRFLRALPPHRVDKLMEASVPTGRDIAIDLIRRPTYARNFLELGLEEIRDVPERPDVSTIGTCAQVVVDVLCTIPIGRCGRVGTLSSPIVCSCWCRFRLARWYRANLTRY